MLKPCGDRDDGVEKKGRNFQAKVETLAEKGRSRRRREMMDDIGSSLSELSLEKRPSLLKEIRGRDEVVVKELYYTFTFEPLQSLRLRF